MYHRSGELLTVDARLDLTEMGLMPTDNTPSHSSLEASPFGRIFSSFASPDFRFIFFHNILNFLGITMELLAQGWVVLIVTDSPFWVGGVAGVRGVGQVSFGALGGLLADRFNRRVVLTVAQLFRAATFLLLGLLIITDRVELWHLLLVALAQGMLMATVLPSSDALAYDIVGSKRLLNALAIKHGAFSLVTIPGSILAGILITTAGVGSCYLVITGVLFFSPLPLLFMKARYSRPLSSEPIWQNLRGGLSYAAKANSLRSLLLFSVIMETFGFSFFIMLPVIARDVLEVGATGLGFLSATRSVGSLVATFAVASLGDFRAKSLVLTLGAAAAGIFLLFFALSPWYAASLVLAALIGAGLVAYDITLGTMLQQFSIDEMRGRVLGLYSLTFGFMPVGGFISGAVATVMSVSFALGMGGVVILAAVAAILLPARSLWEPANPPMAGPEGETGGDRLTGDESR